MQSETPSVYIYAIAFFSAVAFGIEARKASRASTGISSLCLKWIDLVLFIFFTLAALQISRVAGGFVSGFADTAQDAQEWYFAQGIVVQIIFLAFIFLFARTASEKIEFSESFVSARKAALLGLQYFFFIFPLFLIAYFWKLGLEGFCGLQAPQQDAVDIFFGLESFWGRFAAVLSVVILAPLFEEFFFRGLIYRIFKAYMPVVFSAMLTAVLFSAIHVNLYALLPIFLFSLLLTMVYERSGSIIAPVVLHSAFNLFNALNILFDL